MKILICALLAVVLFTTQSSAQVQRPAGNPTVNAPTRFDFIFGTLDSAKMFRNVDTFPARYATLIFHTSKQYYYTEGNGTRWYKLVDTVGLSSRINLKLNISDTAAMLAPYARTASAGTVNTIGITTANGVSGVSSGGQDPRLTVTLGDITPTSVDASVSITTPKITTTNNGAGDNIRVGNDADIGDINVSNTISIKGIQNPNTGFIKFGIDGNRLGYDGVGLNYGGSITQGSVASAILAANLTGTISNVTVGSGLNYNTTTRELKVDTSSNNFINNSFALQNANFNVYNGYHRNIGVTDIDSTHGGIIIGDSIVVQNDFVYYWGNSVTSSGGYTGLLSTLLGTNQINKGISNTRMQQVSAGDSSMQNRAYSIPAYVSTTRYAMLDYGINDMANLGGGSIANFISVYSSVIDSFVAKGYPLNRIVIITPSYIGTSGGKNADSLALFAAAAKSVALAKGTLFADVFNYLKANGGAANVSSDSVHPSTIGYARMAEYIYYCISGSLKVYGGQIISRGDLKIYNGGISTNGGITMASGNLAINNGGATATQYFTGKGFKTLNQSVDSAILSNGTQSTIVKSITGTANQVIASAPKNNVTLSLPQDIATTSDVRFGYLELGSTPSIKGRFNITENSASLVLARIENTENSGVLNWGVWGSGGGAPFTNQGYIEANTPSGFSLSSYTGDMKFYTNARALNLSLTSTSADINTKVTIASIATGISADSLVVVHNGELRKIYGPDTYATISGSGSYIQNQFANNATAQTNSKAHLSDSLTTNGVLTVGGAANIAGTTTFSGTIVQNDASASINTHSNTSAINRSLLFIRSRGTLASQTTIVNGDPMGLVGWQGYDGAANRTAGYIQGSVDNTVSSGIVPGRIGFFTANTAGTAVEAGRINSLQNWLFGTTAHSGAPKLDVTGKFLATDTAQAGTIARIGGTSAQLLAADGSVATAGTGITISGGTISASGGVISGLTTNTITKATSSTTIGNSQVTDDGTTVQINGSIGITSKFQSTAQAGSGVSAITTAATSASSQYLYYGVNTATGGNTFTVAATGAILSNDLAGTGSRAVLADATGLLSAPVSDSTVKENFSKFGYGINAIMKLKPVWGEYKKGWKNYGEGRQNFLIAQNVQQVIPEAVFKTPSTGKLGINKDQLDAVYVQALQDLQNQIFELKKEINKLKKKK